MILLLFTGPVLASYEDGGKAYLQKDYSAALENWSKAAQSDDLRALFALGVMYSRGLGVDKDTEKGVDYYRRAADFGFTSAQFNLGLAYYSGVGVEKNIAEAKNWWHQAAEQGHLIAQYNFASLLWTGNGTVQDQAQAMHWFRKAKNGGSRDASNFLLTLYAPMYKELNSESLDLASRAAPGKKIPLVDEIGMYVLGQQAMTKKNYAQAYGFWEPLALDGHIESQYQLGKLYEFGKGVKPNFDVAMDWYQKAAQKGQGDAQFRLGQYHINESPDKNEPLGLYWIQSAADNNSTEASEFLKSY